MKLILTAAAASGAVATQHQAECAAKVQQIQKEYPKSEVYICNLSQYTFDGPNVAPGAVLKPTTESPGNYAPEGCVIAIKDPTTKKVEMQWILDGLATDSPNDATSLATTSCKESHCSPLVENCGAFGAMSCGAHFHEPTTSAADGCNQAPGAVLGNHGPAVRYNEDQSLYIPIRKDEKLVEYKSQTEKPIHVASEYEGSLVGKMALLHRYDGTFASCGKCELAKPLATGATGDAPAMVFFTAAVAAAGAALF
jgi:hypothetical protein